MSFLNILGNNCSKVDDIKSKNYIIQQKQLR